MDGTHLVETNHILKDKLTAAGICTDELMRKIADEGTLANIPGIPEDIRFSSVPTTYPHLACQDAGAFGVYRQRGSARR